MSDKTTKPNWFKRHKIITGVLAAFIIIGIIGAIGDSNTSNQPAAASTSSNTSSSSSSTAPTTPGLNQEARDGKFAFTVTSFSCGETAITQPDNSYSTATAQGQFCVMNLSIKNIGTVAQDFDASSQYVYDASSKQYSYSSDATITANPSSSQFPVYETINPGVSVSGIVVFDVPRGVTPTYAMLHDSGASNGVKVALQ